MGTRSFPGVKSGRGVTLTSHSLLVPWSWKSRAIPLLPLWAVRPVQSLSACTRVHFTFAFKEIWLFLSYCKSIHFYESTEPSLVRTRYFVAPWFRGLEDLTLFGQLWVLQLVTSKFGSCSQRGTNFKDFWSAELTSCCDSVIFMAVQKRRTCALHLTFDVFSTDGFEPPVTEI